MKRPGQTCLSGRQGPCNSLDGTSRTRLPARQGLAPEKGKELTQELIQTIYNYLNRTQLEELERKGIDGN
jgi:hypothetical protein